MHFDINLERDEVYECGALLLTVLACAKGIEEERSVQLYLSLCGKALWLSHLENPDDWTPITVKPQYVFRDPQAIDRDVDFIARRVAERMVAGRMAFPFFERAKFGRVGPLPKGIKRLSINQMAAHVLGDAGQSDPENLKKRVWGPSRPVIRLATAAAIVGQQLHKSGFPLTLEYFLFDRFFAETVLRLAGNLQGLIAQDPKFPVKVDQLIQLRMG